MIKFNTHTITLISQTRNVKFKSMKSVLIFFNIILFDHYTKEKKIKDRSHATHNTAKCKKYQILYHKHLEKINYYDNQY